MIRRLRLITNRSRLSRISLFAFYRQARCYALLHNMYSAVEYLRRAIALHPDTYRQRAMNDPVMQCVHTTALLAASPAAIPTS